TPQPQPVVNQPLSLSETDAFRAKVESCWSIPAGAREAADLVVTLRIFLNPDGSLAGRPEIVDGERMNRPGGEFFRTAAESAIRAVLRCAPYEMLPAAKYDSWRDIRLTFDPRELG
ncbi:MAG: cell envelope integrity protein TolA, partial [Proteobacteria bacterium]|nr:cell envelope integrity protein TolA [Pseudomonadota bacterium]